MPILQLSWYDPPRTLSGAWLASAQRKWLPLPYPTWYLWRRVRRSSRVRVRYVARWLEWRCLQWMSFMKPRDQSARRSKTRCPRLLDIRITRNEVETNFVDSKETIQGRQVEHEVDHILVSWSRRRRHYPIQWYMGHILVQPWAWDPVRTHSPKVTKLSWQIIRVSN